MLLIAAQGFLCGGAPSAYASIVNGILASAQLGTSLRILLIRSEQYLNGLHLNNPYIRTLRKNTIVKGMCRFDSEVNTRIFLLEPG